jgi:hypothetical protein
MLSPRERLFYELRQIDGVSAVLIGDAYAPRDLQRAIGHGHRAARAIA